MKAEFDSTLPKSLKETQEWFASVISQPIDRKNRICPKAPSGTPIRKEASKYILSGPKLEPFQRIEIYNQQYWWRLLGVLRLNYPLVTRLFGFDIFNRKIAIPFLQDYPPDHWAIDRVGDRLPEWIQNNYKGKDKRLVYDASILDKAFTEGVFAGELPPINTQIVQESGGLEGILETKLYLQPYLRLFEFPYNLFEFREQMIEESDTDYWLTHKRPELKHGQKFTYILYRDQDKYLECRKIPLTEFSLLSHFKTGASLVDLLEQMTTDPAQEQVESHLQNWLCKWITCKWLTATTPGFK